MNMSKKILNDLEYLKQNYRPSEIQKLLNNSKTKRAVYQELKVSEYILNNYIKLYNLSGVKKKRPSTLNNNKL
jgi:hypothetical protein